MAFQSLHQVLTKLEHKEEWQEQRRFQRLLAAWPAVVGEAVAAQTRPLGIQRQVLQVATSSSAWAQTLSFERLRILAKLNAHLNQTLTDVRFSTLQWQQRPSPSPEASASMQRHPSWVAPPSRPPQPRPPKPQDAETAFQAWATQIRLRSHPLPLCPGCHCPTPEGELQRWSVCSLCAARRFGASGDRSPASPAAP